MLIKGKRQSDESENSVTPEAQYLNRRTFMLGATAAFAAGGVGAVAWQRGDQTRVLNELSFKSGTAPDGEVLTSYEAITQYNNYYEFGVSKSDPARNAHTLVTTPWTVKVDGLVNNPGDYAFDDLIDMPALEERIYRLRCVEAWSMVVPWIGIPLNKIIKKLEPQGSAKYVSFETLNDRSTMPGVRWPVLDWPYVEALRMDEAMNDLALIAVGLYGKEIPNQNGAPLRLVVPWKYGFKSIKSIVRISFTEKQPRTSWQKSAPQEYGFYSNVNPLVDHPRWSQAKERRIGEFGRRDTLMFNGYAEEVGDLYAGMDLAKYY